MNGYALVRKSDQTQVQVWTAIPERIEAADLRVDGAQVGWADDVYTIVSVTLPDPPVPVPQISKSTILSRLTDAQLDQALSLMTNRQKERWRAADHPVVNADDPETLQVLQAIGADPAVVLATE